MIEIQLHILDGHIKTDRVLYLQETLITLAKNYSNKSLNLIMRVFFFPLFSEVHTTVALTQSGIQQKTIVKVKDSRIYQKFSNVHNFNSVITLYRNNILRFLILFHCVRFPFHLCTLQITVSFS